MKEGNEMLKRFALFMVFASLAIGTAKAQTFIEQPGDSINLLTVQPTDVFLHFGGVDTYGTQMFYPNWATFDLVSLNLSCGGV
jgi:hypothetical protein